MRSAVLVDCGRASRAEGGMPVDQQVAVGLTGHPSGAGRSRIWRHEHCRAGTAACAARRSAAPPRAAAQAARKLASSCAATLTAPGRLVRRRAGRPGTRRIPAGASPAGPGAAASAGRRHRWRRRRTHASRRAGGLVAERRRAARAGVRSSTVSGTVCRTGSASQVIAGRVQERVDAVGQSPGHAPSSPDRPAQRTPFWPTAAASDVGRGPSACRRTRPRIRRPVTIMSCMAAITA